MCISVVFFPLYTHEGSRNIEFVCVYASVFVYTVGSTCVRLFLLCLVNLVKQCVSLSKSLVDYVGVCCPEQKTSAILHERAHIHTGHVILLHYLRLLLLMFPLPPKLQTNPSYFLSFQFWLWHILLTHPLPTLILLRKNAILHRTYYSFFLSLLSLYCLLFFLFSSFFSFYRLFARKFLPFFIFLPLFFVYFLFSFFLSILFLFVCLFLFFFFVGFPFVLLIIFCFSLFP